MWVERGSRHFECSDRLGSIDGGKIEEESVERLTCFQVVEEIFHRNTSSREHRHSTLNFGIRVEGSFYHCSLLRHLTVHARLNSGIGAGTVIVDNPLLVP